MNAIPCLSITNTVVNNQRKKEMHGSYSGIKFKAKSHDSGSIKT